MASKHTATVVDNLFRFMTGVDLPFGGKVFIFGGTLFLTQVLYVYFL